MELVASVADDGGSFVGAGGDVQVRASKMGDPVGLEAVNGFVKHGAELLGGAEPFELDAKAFRRGGFLLAHREVSHGPVAGVQCVPFSVIHGALEAA